MSNTKDIKRRIKSVKNTKKITKAMELVAASKMRKAVGKVLQSRSYAQVAWQTVMTLVKKVDANLNPLLRQEKEIKKIAIVVVSSNRGLCGGFNNNIIQLTSKHIKNNLKEVQEVDIITVGKKGYKGLSRYAHTMKADFEKKDVTVGVTDIYPISHLILQSFIKKEYDQVLIAYTDFQTALSQEARITQLLPLTPDEVDTELGAVDKQDSNDTDSLKEVDYLLEPNASDLLEQILPKIIEIKLYQAVLESDASEHSSRMLAMRNASEAADDMIDSLTFAFNRARQASITQEISEISAGKASLEN